jgi:hypothetical protein
VLLDAEELEVWYQGMIAEKERRREYSDKRKAPAAE